MVRGLVGLLVKGLGLLVGIGIVVLVETIIAALVSALALGVIGLTSKICKKIKTFLKDVKTPAKEMIIDVEYKVVNENEGYLA